MNNSQKLKIRRVYSEKELEKKGWQKNKNDFSNYEVWKKGKRVVFRDVKTGKVTHIFLTLDF
jgi:hypothetical protein